MFRFVVGGDTNHGDPVVPPVAGPLLRHHENLYIIFRRFQL